MREGVVINHCGLFPEHTNVEFCKVINPESILMRVLERGSGETLACGTVACAAVIASVERGFCKHDMNVTVKLLGGNLKVRFSSDGFVYLTGDPKKVYDGVIEI